MGDIIDLEVLALNLKLFPGVEDQFDAVRRLAEHPVRGELRLDLEHQAVRRRLMFLGLSTLTEFSTVSDSFQEVAA